MTVGPAPSPKGSVPQPKVLLLDLDDTLYRNHKVPTIVKERIQGKPSWACGEDALWASRVRPAVRLRFCATPVCQRVVT